MFSLRGHPILKYQMPLELLYLQRVPRPLLKLSANKCLQIWDDKISDIESNKTPVQSDHVRCLLKTQRLQLNSNKSKSAVRCALDWRL